MYTNHYISLQGNDWLPITLLQLICEDTERHPLLPNVVRSALKTIIYFRPHYNTLKCSENFFLEEQIVLRKNE